MDNYTMANDTMGALESLYAYQLSMLLADYTSDSYEFLRQQTLAFFHDLERSIDGDDTEVDNPPHAANIPSHNGYGHAKHDDGAFLASDDDSTASMASSTVHQPMMAKVGNTTDSANIIAASSSIAYPPTRLNSLTLDQPLAAAGHGDIVDNYTPPLDLWTYDNTRLEPSEADAKPKGNFASSLAEPHPKLAPQFQDFSSQNEQKSSAMERENIQLKRRIDVLEDTVNRLQQLLATSEQQRLSLEEQLLRYTQRPAELPPRTLSEQKSMNVLLKNFTLLRSRPPPSSAAPDNSQPPRPQTAPPPQPPQSHQQPANTTQEHATTSTNDILGYGDLMMTTLTPAKSVYIAHDNDNNQPQPSPFPTKIMVDEAHSPIKPSTAGPSVSPTPHRHLYARLNPHNGSTSPAPSRTPVRRVPLIKPTTKLANDNVENSVSHQLVTLRQENLLLRQENARLQRQVGDAATAITGYSIHPKLRHEYWQRHMDDVDNMTKVELANCLKITMLELLHCKDPATYCKDTRVAAKLFRVMHAFCELLYGEYMPSSRHHLVDAIVAGDVVAFNAAFAAMAKQFHLHKFLRYLNQVDEQ